MVVVSCDETEWPWVKGEPASQRKSQGCWCLAVQQGFSQLGKKKSDRMDSNINNMVGWAFGSTTSAISRH